jgi:hypothetical protein
MKRMEHVVKVYLLGGFLLLSLSSCMHLLMSDKNATDTTSDSVIDKQISEGNVDIHAVIPVLTMNEPQPVSIDLHYRDTQMPMSSAVVSFHFTKLDTMGEMHGHEMHSVMDSGVVHGIAQEISSGKYSFVVTPSNEGHSSLLISVKTMASDSLQKAIEFKVQRTVKMQHSNMGMMGMGGTSNYLIIGGIVMAAMMIAVWTTRGGM